MRVVIVGMGDIGRELAHELLAEGWHELVLVDNDPAMCSRMAGELDALVIEGDGTHPEILDKAQIDKADALVACTGSDALNTVVAMLAHAAGVETIIVKLDDLALRPACRQIGATRIVAPTIAAAWEIRAALSGLRRTDLSVLSRGGLLLVELDAGARAGRRVSELALPEGASLVAVMRGEDIRLPGPQIRLRDRDTLICLVEGESGRTALEGYLAAPDA